MLFLTVITVNEDESQTHIGWQIDQEVVDLLHVMLGAPRMHAIIPAETYPARLAATKDMVVVYRDGSPE